MTQLDIAPENGVRGDAVSSVLSLSVVVPSYRRPDDLNRCLEALIRQTRPASQVIVIRRADDQETRRVINRFVGDGPVVEAVVHEPGAVAAYNLGIEIASGGIISITDDDAAPHPDWLERVATYFDRDPCLGGVGGRDVVHEEGRIIEISTSSVGMIQIFGRLIGNHHIGHGPARRVHLLKGVNMSFRRSALAQHRFDSRLKGSGAQVHLEIGICSAIRRDGWDILYDPEILVDHYPSVRHDEDVRAVFNSIAHRNAVHNETLALLDYLPWWRRALFAIWAFTVGTRPSPGLLAGMRTAFEPHAWERLKTTFGGRIDGGRTWLNTST